MTNRKKSQKQEKEVAKEFNAKTTPASGAKWSQKGDVRNSKFLIECKTTGKDYYRVTAKTWEKIEEEATRDHMRIPLLVVDLNDGADRLIVFKASAMEFKKNMIYECSKDYEGDIPPKSRKISMQELIEINEDVDFDVVGRLFMICGNHNSMLIYMRIKDFEEYYKEELYWD